MNNEFLSYLARLETMVFFSGYAVVYLIIQLIANAKPTQPNSFSLQLYKLLPYAYGTVGVLFLGYTIKNTFLAGGFHVLKGAAGLHYHQWWGLLAIVFLLPTCSRKPLFSLLHSLVFLFFILRDLVLYLGSFVDRTVIANDMKIYTDSLLLNACAVIFTAIIYFMAVRMRKK